MFLTRNNIPQYTCSLCSIKLVSENKLFNHFKKQCWENKSPVSPTVRPAVRNMHFTEPLIIESSITPNQIKTPGYGFKRWKYVTIKVFWESGFNAKLTEMCLDNGCSVTLMDKSYFQKQIPFAEIKKMSSPIPVRGMGNKIIRKDENATVKMFVIGTNQGKPAKASFFIENHLINEMKANLLIKTNIFKPQRTNINYDNDIVIFGSCQNFKTTIDVRIKISFNVKRTIKTKSAVVIPPFTIIQVPVTYKGVILDDRDFLFEPEC